MKEISPWLLAVFSGVIGFLGYVGFNQFYLEWVFMVPLLWAIRDKTPGRIFLLGLADRHRRACRRVLLVFTYAH